MCGCIITSQSSGHQNKGCYHAKYFSGPEATNTWPHVYLVLERVALTVCLCVSILHVDLNKLHRFVRCWTRQPGRKVTQRFFPLTTYHIELYGLEQSVSQKWLICSPWNVPRRCLRIRWETTVVMERTPGHHVFDKYLVQTKELWFMFHRLIDAVFRPGC